VQQWALVFQIARADRNLLQIRFQLKPTTEETMAASGGVVVVIKNYLEVDGFLVHDLRNDKIGAMIDDGYRRIKREMGS
jgi:hypothetical protein